jgi:flagellar biogenesis protein FliO
MNLLRLTHPGAGLTTAVVLLCGIVSGAAMAAGNPGQQQPTSALGAVPTPSHPTVAAIPAIPGVPTPHAQALGSATHVPRPQAVQTPPLSPSEASARPVDDDALVLRPKSRYDRKMPQQPAEAPAVAEAPQAIPSLVEAKPFGGLNINALGLILFVLLGVAGFLAYRKKHEETASATDLTLEVASTIRVGSRWQVSLVRVPGRMLVVGSTDKGLELLTELYPDADEEAVDELLANASSYQMPTTTQERPTRPEVEPPTQRAPVDAFDLLADVSPRFDTPPSSGTYGRPARRQAAPTPPPQSSKPGHDDAFLDAVLDRLSKARPAVVRHTPSATPQVDERAALRAQIKQYRRGPTRL